MTLRNKEREREREREKTHPSFCAEITHTRILQRHGECINIKNVSLNYTEVAWCYGLDFGQKIRAKICI